MEDTNILDIDPKILREIKLFLANEGTRKSFITVLPLEMFGPKENQLLEIKGNSSGEETAHWLLFRLGSKNACVSHFICWFADANLERGLMLLKKEASLRITNQPPSRKVVCEGSSLSITCEAISCPPPEYQWFKDEVELLLQQESELYIPSATKQDCGKYKCCIKHNIHEGGYSQLFSDPVEIVISSDTAKQLPVFKSNPSEPQSILTPSTMVAAVIQDENNREQVFNKEKNSNLGGIKIMKHPYCGRKVSQGSNIYLKCEAISSDLLHYQWYKNSDEMYGETSPTLYLNELYPDPESGDVKFEFICEISNAHKKVLSKAAIVELSEADDTTPFVAEEKIALMIANDIYAAYDDNLETPAADVADLTYLLKSINFKVLSFRNLSLKEFKQVFSAFCDILKPNSYALFLFAGHGFELFGQTYLQPVDCSENCLPEESICAEYILQCMQETKPALNVLLIDCCRKLPPDPWLGPGKIFEAHMKNNTIYGYSTTFLSGAYECHERNSFFVKHLKRYITQNKSITDILFQVQRAFYGERSTIGLQNPVIKSSLSVPRKLRDNLRNSNSASIPRRPYQRREPLPISLPHPICSRIIIEVKDHMETFLNGIDIYTYLDVEKNANKMILESIEMNLVFYSEKLRVLPIEGVYLKDRSLKLDAKTLLFKKQLLGIQNLEGHNLRCKIVLKFPGFEEVQEKEFLLAIEKFDDLINFC